MSYEKMNTYANAANAFICLRTGLLSSSKRFMNLNMSRRVTLDSRVWRRIFSIKLWVRNYLEPQKLHNNFKTLLSEKPILLVGETKMNASSRAPYKINYAVRCAGTRNSQSWSRNEKWIFFKSDDNIDVALWPILAIFYQLLHNFYSTSYLPKKYVGWWKYHVMNLTLCRAYRGPDGESKEKEASLILS